MEQARDASDEMVWRDTPEDRRPQMVRSAYGPVEWIEEQKAEHSKWEYLKTDELLTDKKQEAERTEHAGCVPGANWRSEGMGTQESCRDVPAGDAPSGEDAAWGVFV